MLKHSESGVQPGRLNPHQLHRRNDGGVMATTSDSGAFGRLAQLVRAPALQAGGRRFESPIAHQTSLKCVANAVPRIISA